MDFPNHKVFRENLPYQYGEITHEELKLVLKKFKRRKAPGPDEVPMEIFKEMSDENLNIVLDILNEWLAH